LYPLEQDDLAGRGQVLHVALEVPLGALPFGRGRQRGDPGGPGVEVLGHPLDRAALARRVAALEDDHDPGTLGAHPFLHFHQLALQAVQLGLVQLPGQPLGSVGVVRRPVLPVALDLAWHRRVSPRLIT
jgi:hypothetical protein